jgi:tRNA threonylcarbamoyladenosine biosynthesis protein TsaE
MSAPFEFVANDERDTDRFGAALAHVLPRGAVVALVGTLGAGKTRLVQAVARSVGIDPREVLSPTFVLVHEYRVQGSGFRVQEGREHQEPGEQSAHELVGAGSVYPVSAIYHIDAYRIRDDDEFRELGPEEYFESDGWTFIEWADRVANCLPRDHVEINISVTGPTTRRFAVAASGQPLIPVITALATHLR